MSIVVNFTGWLLIDKKNLSICDANLNKVDTSNMTDEKISEMINSGDYLIDSLADCLKNSEDYTLDSIDSETD